MSQGPGVLVEASILDGQPIRAISFLEPNDEWDSGYGIWASAPDRIGATARERNSRAEGVGRPDQRPDVPGIGDAPERKGYVPLALGQVVPSEDRDDPRRVAERGHLAQELWQNVLPGDQ